MENGIEFNEINIKSDKNFLLESAHPLLSILDKSLRIDEACVIHDALETSKEANKNCKIFKISSKFTIEAALKKLENLKHEEYSNLFIFIIEATNFEVFGTNLQISENFVKIKDILIKFDANRPIILQLTTESENNSQVYFKNKNCCEFLNISQIQKSSENLNFPSFLCSILNGKFDACLNLVFENLPDLKDSSTILKFLRLFKLSEDFLANLVIEYAACGSVCDLLAVLDASFKSDPRTLSLDAQNYLSNVLFEEDSTYNSQSESDEAGVDDQNESSVLSTAVENKNTEIIEYLIGNFTHLIQQLPFKHQVKVSTSAFTTQQNDVLCDLLELSDFPFPSNFNPNQIEHKRLKSIITDRTDFSSAIIAKDFEQITKFINRNLNLKVVFNPANNSALKQAVNAKKYKIFYYLKSLGFQAIDVNIESELNFKELKKAKKYKSQQMNTNVSTALDDHQVSVNLLCNRSLIHNKRISKEQEADYRKKIRKWYEDINKVQFGSDLLNVAACCKGLKLIFDFEDQSVENASLEGPNSIGSTHTLQKWIFIGAKSSNINRDQTIKGVIAHELCHYVLKLVYENNENPYYKHCVEQINKFKEIVNSIDKWSMPNSEHPDDECDKIISSVFTHYESNDFHQELIVRVIQILAQFDDDEDKTDYLQKYYNELFEYFRIYVLPEMQNFNLQIRENVRKINRIMELLPDVMNRKLELVESKNIVEMLSNKITVVSTNVPKLLFVDLINQMYKKFGDIFKAQNIFIDPEKLKNQEIFEDVKQLLEQNLDLNIFVDYSKKINEDFENLAFSNSLKFIFIVSSKSHEEKLVQMASKKNWNSTFMEISYDVNDLTTQSQKKLLQTMIKFQNSSNCTLLDLLLMKGSENEECDEKVASEILDIETLNLILENSPISINSNFKVNQNFDLLFQPRDFIKRQQQKDIQTQKKVLKINPATKHTKISQKELLTQVKDKKYIIISDIAGSGKSWAMKKVTKNLYQSQPTKWITYVDLKHFIKDLKTQNQSFPDFFVDKILKLQNDKFEAKLFQKMYFLGKVVILFDGFDEIAPDCAEIVTKLAQLFEHHAGNQLWIATRNYFEINLQMILEGAETFNLSSFSDKDGEDFIVNSWILQDLKDDSKVKSKDDFKKCTAESKNHEIYHQLARQIVKKIVISDSRSVGMPQLFKIIAESFKNDADITTDIKKFRIYKKFAKILYERWSSAKGAIRKTANTESQDYDLNFQQLHQYSALSKLFADLLEYLFPNCDISEWSDEEIVACGMMTKTGDEFSFLHETFCEFYVADFISGILTKKKIKFNDSFCELFARVLTIKKFEVIREFLSDVIDDFTILEKIREKMTKQIEYFNEMKIFHQYFFKLNEHFACFIIEILKRGDYSKVQRILFNTAEAINLNAVNSNLFTKYQDFIIDFITVKDLKKLIEERLIFHKFIQSSRGVEIFEDFVVKVAAKTDKEFIKSSFKLLSSDGFEENIFNYLVQSSLLNAKKIDEFLELLQKYLELSEIFELLKSCNKNSENVLQICIQTGNNEKLKVLWTAVEKNLSSANFSQLIKKTDLRKKSVLHFVRTVNKIDLQETFLQLLTKSFESQEELKDFLLQKEFNFIHDLIEKDEDTSNIEMTLNILKSYFKATQIQEILLVKHKRDRNLLQMAGFKSKKLSTHQFLWKFYRDSFNDDQQFLDVIKQVDFFGNNIIQIAVYELPNEFFDFMMNELEKLPRPDAIVEILSNINKWNRNVLQSESKWTKSAELHENLWNKFRKYFKSEEILNFIQHVDKFGNHLLFNAVENNKKEFVELIWKDIKSFMNRNEQIIYLKAENNDGKNLLQMSIGNKEYFNEVYEWVQNVMAEYDVQLKSLCKNNFFIEKFPIRKCCKNTKWIGKLEQIKEDV